MLEGDQDGGGGSLVALGELLGEVVEEAVFVFDLDAKRVVRIRLEGKSAMRRTITLVLTSTVITENLQIFSRVFRFGSRYAKTSP